MASRIKGITIEIGGDTTGLDKALKSVNSSITHMPVVPIVTATAETALSWQVGSDTFQKSVSSGTWEFPELELQAGQNRISVSGTGTVTFRYREGRL